jgi:hypothetical protein
MVEDDGEEPEGEKGDKDLIDDMSLMSSTRLPDSNTKNRRLFEAKKERDGREVGDVLLWVVVIDSSG